MRWRTLPTKINIWREKPALDEKIVQAQRSSRQRKREEGRLAAAFFYAKEYLLQVNDMSRKFIFTKEWESFYLNIEPVA